MHFSTNFIHSGNYVIFQHSTKTKARKLLKKTYVLLSPKLALERPLKIIKILVLQVVIIDIIVNIKRFTLQNTLALWSKAGFMINAIPAESISMSNS